MDTLDILKMAISILDVVLEVGVITVYASNIYWLIQIYKIMDRNNPFLWMGKALTVVSGLFIVSFGYLFSLTILGTPLELTSFGVIYIRPIIFLMGSIICGISRMSYRSLKQGGKVWISRRPNL